MEIVFESQNYYENEIKFIRTSHQDDADTYKVLTIWYGTKQAVRDTLVQIHEIAVYPYM